MPPTLRPRKGAHAATSPSPSVTSSSGASVPTAAAPSYSEALKKRPPRSVRHQKPLSTDDDDEMSRSDEERPFIDGPTPDDDVEVPPKSLNWAQRNQWVVYALASGACAACNGVFAKLTTTKLTATFSLAIARLLGLESIEGAIEIIVRCIFFGLNLIFNGVMWTLFTKALARGNSTTQVSIMNTSSNFVITAVLGFAIFSEALPPLWWIGATMLIAGNVIVGRKDEGVSPADEAAVGVEGDREEETGDVTELVSVKDESDEDLVDLGSAVDENERC